jgi:hypothetical protein
MPSKSLKAAAPPLEGFDLACTEDTLLLKPVHRAGQHLAKEPDALDDRLRPRAGRPDRLERQGVLAAAAGNRNRNRRLNGAQDFVRDISGPRIEHQNAAVHAKPVEEPFQPRGVRVDIVLCHRPPGPSIRGLNRVRTIRGLDERAAIDVYLLDDPLKEAFNGARHRLARQPDQTQRDLADEAVQTFAFALMG